MIRKHKLLIDKDCPMCGLYGKCFTDLGLIDKETLSPYQDVPSEISSHVDMERARNEIAFFDTETQRAHYGLEAFIKILSQGSGAFESFLRFVPLYFLLTKLYRLISYNRKVIYPYAKQSDKTCEPDLNRKYRWLFVFLVALSTGFILNGFSEQVDAFFQIEHRWEREYYVCFGQIVWQGVVCAFFFKDKYLHYLGNMSAVSLAGGLAMLPLIIIGQYVEFSIYVYFVYFGLVVGGMMWEHLRRCRLMGLPLGMTLSWVSYRTFVLVLIVLLNTSLF